MLLKLRNYYFSYLNTLRENVLENVYQNPPSLLVHSKTPIPSVTY